MVICNLISYCPAVHVRSGGNVRTVIAGKLLLNLACRELVVRCAPIEPLSQKRIVCQLRTPSLRASGITERISRSRRGTLSRVHIGGCGGCVSTVIAGRHLSFPGHTAVQAVRSARERSLFQEKMILPVSFLKSRRNGIQRKMRRSPRSRSRHTAICVSGGFVLWDIHGKHQLHRVRTTQPAAHTAPGGWCLPVSMTCKPAFLKSQCNGIRP